MAVKFYLDPRPDKLGEHPIRASISIRGARLISTAGYNIGREKWNEEAQKVKKGYSNEKKVSWNVINARLKAIDSHFASYEIGLDHRPTVDELSGELAAVKGTTRRRMQKEATTVLDYFDKFIKEESRDSQWTTGTLATWQTTKKHLRNFGEDATLSDFDENGIARYVDILRNRTKLGEASIRKEYKHLSWFLRWCLRKQYTTEDAILRYKPKFKVLDKPVIFLTKDELMKLYHYEIPQRGTIVKLVNQDGEEYEKTVEHKDGLENTRDLFCFCAFTSLRYSDAAALRKKDVANGRITIVTKKTSERLEIELNDYAKAILSKYEDSISDLALPAISNQKANDYLKDLCELCGINNPVSRMYFQEGRQVEVSAPKYQLMGTHAGRRTFICFALESGISPNIVMKWTGHSDYNSMKPYIDIAEKARAEAMKKINNALNK